LATVILFFTSMRRLILRLKSRHKGNESRDIKIFLDYYIKFGDAGRARPYRHILASKDGMDFFLLVWPPGSSTSPHDHAGAFAKVLVLAGSLYRETRGRRKIVFETGSEIIENDSAIHKVGNDSDLEWAMSFHSFKYAKGKDYGMREYPEDGEVSVIIKGDTDVVVPSFKI